MGNKEKSKDTKRFVYDFALNWHTEQSSWLITVPHFLLFFSSLLQLIAIKSLINCMCVCYVLGAWIGFKFNYHILN